MVNGLQYLSVFYEYIEGFLDEYKKAGKLNFDYAQKDIFEEHIGGYPVKVLNIRLGSHKIRLEPIGTVLIGAKGRVDLIGANGKIKFVLVNKQLSNPQTKVKVWIKGQEPPQEDGEPKDIEWGWKIATPPPRIKYLDFGQGTFLAAIMEVIGG